MQEKKGHITLRARVYIFFAAFLLALLGLIYIGRFQSSYIVSTLERENGAFQNISQLMINVEDTFDTMREYSWDYGDPDIFSERIENDRSECAAHLLLLNSDASQISEEQYVLARAVKNTYNTYDSILADILACVQAGMKDQALSLYTTAATPCGDYLILYVQQLLETAIADSQSAYTSITSLGNNVRNVQTILAVCCLILVILSAREVLRILNPLRQLSEASHSISRGEFDGPDLPEDRNDEVGDVERAFNQMKHSTAQQVQTLNEMNRIERELRQKETEALQLQNLAEREKLQQLRTQVNPHFLFNTLNVIAIMASQEEAPRTRELITDLSNLLRYSLLSNDLWVPLSHEMRIVNGYYDIYHTRFGDRIALRWQMPDDMDVTETMVPSLILQPLVENAFRYGIGPKEEGGLVTISIRSIKEWNLLYFCVKDNGCGMEKEQLLKLRAAMKDRPQVSPEGEHIGLLNVAERLNLISSRCRMILSSKLGKGTRVAIFIPLIEEEGEEQDV